MDYSVKSGNWIKILPFIVFSLFNLINPLSVHSIDENISSGALLFPRASEYLIGPEDVLEISVLKNTELSKTVLVRSDGMISLLLIGDISASSLAPITKYGRQIAGL